MCYDVDHIVMLFIQVAQLRQRFYHSIAPGGLAGDRRGVVPASAFSISAQHIWKIIRENKDLDLPAHKVFNLSFFRCNSSLVSQESDILGAILVWFSYGFAFYNR
jgi:hypothetical protein